MLLTEFKDNINQYGNKMLQDIIKSGVGDNFYPIVERGNYTNLELVPYTKEYAEESANYAYRNELSWLGLDDCVDILKKVHKVPYETPLLIRKQDFSTKFTQSQQYLPSSTNDKIKLGVKYYIYSLR